MKRLMALLLMLCIALTGMALAEDELYEEVVNKGREKGKISENRIKASECAPNL